MEHYATMKICKLYLTAWKGKWIEREKTTKLAYDSAKGQTEEVKTAVQVCCSCL